MIACRPQLSLVDIVNAKQHAGLDCSTCKSACRGARSQVIVAGGTDLIDPVFQGVEGGSGTI
jgi:hypothetical protein